VNKALNTLNTIYQSLAGHKKHLFQLCQIICNKGENVGKELYPVTEEDLETFREILDPGHFDEEGFTRYTCLARHGNGKFYLIQSDINPSKITDVQKYIEGAIGYNGHNPLSFRHAEEFLEIGTKTGKSTLRKVPIWTVMLKDGPGNFRTYK
jgi:hypothetical protein